MGAGLTERSIWRERLRCCARQGVPRSSACRRWLCGWAGLKGQPEPLDGPALLGAAMPEYQVLYFPCLEQGNGAGGCAASAT